MIRPFKRYNQLFNERRVFAPAKKWLQQRMTSIYFDLSPTSLEVDR
jgi:hypothetical protein